MERSTIATSPRRRIRMLRISFGIYVAFAMGGIASGCAGEPPAPGVARSAADPSPNEIATDEIVARDSATEDQDLPRSARERSTAAQPPVTVKYVIDPSESAQSIAPAGFQPAASSPAAVPEAPGARRQAPPTSVSTAISRLPRRI
jgi:hypothetical protein